MKPKVFLLLTLVLFVSKGICKSVEVVSPKLPNHWRLEVKTVTHLMGQENHFALVGSLKVSHPTIFDTWFEYGPTPSFGSRTDRISYRGLTTEQLISQAFSVRPGTRIFYRFVAQVEKETTPPFYGEVKQVGLSTTEQVESTKFNQAYESGHMDGRNHVVSILDEQGGKAMPLDDLPHGDYKMLGGANIGARPIGYFLMRNQDSHKDHLVSAQTIEDRRALMSRYIRVRKTTRLEIIPSP